MNAQARVLEPLYRMIKVIGKQDETDAKVLGAVATQYIAEHYQNQALSYEEMQRVLRAVLLYQKDGKYYSAYILNELEVKVAGWVTVLAADLPLTLGAIGEMADKLAQWLEGKDALELRAAEVEAYFEELCGVDAELTKRVLLNREFYLRELAAILGK